jgi:hypothetical protein
MSTPTTEAQGYAGYRLATGFGLGRFTGRQISLVAGTVAVVLITMNFSFLSAVYLAMVAVPVIAIGVIPFGASRRTAAQRVSWFSRAQVARNRAYDAVASGPLTEVPRGGALPGVLAPLLPLDVEDGRGGKQCLLWNRRTGILSAVLLVSPVGITLADTADANSWVATFGAWMADLGHKPMISSVSFNVESSPTGGVDQRAYTLGRIDPHAPLVARQVMNELVSSQPTTTAEVITTVTVNFDPSRANPRPTDLLTGAAEVVRWLPGIEASLTSAGATVVGRATSPWLIRRIRAAFDPAVRVSMADADADELTEWADAGPLRAEADWEVYRHDSGYSVSWVMTAAPSGVVRQRVLIPLTAPGPYSRRFSMVYKPFRAFEAAEQVEREINAGALRKVWSQKTKKDETERDRSDLAKARQAAREESLGAGVGRFTMYLTTTVRNEATLPAAVADAEERAAQTKIQFRRARGAQPAAFAAALGLGIDPTTALSLRADQRWIS